ncbi:MAG: hypothetical protein C5B52_10810 [Bacteroidetes bacterium]|nr:MAG: hypothetical protein C5B52_10810 [Bacteroidota bacterium]
MQPKAFCFFLAIFILAVRSPIFSQQNDSAAIAKLLITDYATMGNMDIPAHVKNVSNDYLLIEKGQVWPIETELDSIYRKFANRKEERTDFFEIRTIKSDGNMAYGLWHLRSTFKEGEKIKELKWNESGVFRKENGEWKIALIHSSMSTN